VQTTVQTTARQADPRTTTIDDRGRQNFDRHAAYVVVAFVAGRALSPRVARRARRCRSIDGLVEYGSLGGHPRHAGGPGDLLASQAVVLM
jgi:hypothetical protein